MSAKNTVNFILSGLGGQGILFMTKILAHTALSKGINIMGAETHGMAQRGGSVVSHLKLGDVTSSLVAHGSSHFLLALEENEAYRNLPFLGKRSRLYANASVETFPRLEVKSFLDRLDIEYRSLPAGPMAMELGAPLSSNLALLGFFSAFQQGPFSQQEIRATIDQVSPDRFKEINLKVFDAGLHEGAKQV